MRSPLSAATAAALLFGVGLVAATPAGAADTGLTRLVVTSEHGDPLLAGGSVDVAAATTAELDAAGDLRLRTATPAGGIDIVVRAGGGAGTRLQAGLYETAAPDAAPPGDGPGLAVTAGGRACDGASGRFRVDEAVYGSDRLPAALTIRFELRCGGATGGMVGTVALHGTVPFYAQVPSSSALTFDRGDDGPGAIRTVTLTNTSTTPMPIPGAAITGPDAADFVVTFDGCTGAFLAVDDSCTISIRHREAASRRSVAALHVVDAASSWGDGAADPRRGGYRVLLVAGEATPANTAIPPDPAPLPPSSAPATSAGATPAPAPGGGPGSPGQTAATAATATPATGADAPASTDATAAGAAAASDPPQASTVSAGVSGASTPSAASRSGGPRHRNPWSLLAGGLGLSVGLALAVLRRRARVGGRPTRPPVVGVDADPVVDDRVVPAMPAAAARDGDRGQDRDRDRVEVAPASGEARGNVVPAAPEPLLRLFGGPVFTDRSASARASTVAAWLARSPGGLTVDVLAPALGAVSTDTADGRAKAISALSRVRTALGVVDGHPLLGRAGTDGRYRLDAAVTTDVERFEQLRALAARLPAPDAVAVWTVAFAELAGPAFVRHAPPWLVDAGLVAELDGLVAASFGDAIAAASAAADAAALDVLASHRRRLLPASLPGERPEVPARGAARDAVLHG